MLRIEIPIEGSERATVHVADVSGREGRGATITRRVMVLPWGFAVARLPR